MEKILEDGSDLIPFRNSRSDRTSSSEAETWWWRRMSIRRVIVIWCSGGGEVKGGALGGIRVF